MEFSVVVAWGAGEEQSGQQVSVQSQIRSTAKAQRNHTYAQCGRYYKQHHRPLQIPIKLKICRSVCKCAKVIWRMWKCRNVHLEGGTGGSCPAMQWSNLVGDIWRAKWLQVKLALIHIWSFFLLQFCVDIWCKNSQIQIPVWSNFLLFICLQRKQRCERCRPLLRTHSAVELFSSFYIWQMGRVVFGKGWRGI